MNIYMNMFVYIYTQGVDLTQLDCWLSRLCKADTGAWSPDRQTGKEYGHKVRESKSKYPRRVLNTLFNGEYIRLGPSKKQFPSRQDLGENLLSLHKWRQVKRTRKETWGIQNRQEGFPSPELQAGPRLHGSHSDQGHCYCQNLGVTWKGVEKKYSVWSHPAFGTPGDQRSR